MELNLGEVSGKLQQMGIEIDQQGNIVIWECYGRTAAKGNGWTDHKEAAAVAMAGKRQYNNLIALFDNWDMYTEAVDTSAMLWVTLQNQQDIYMESLKLIYNDNIF